MIGTSFSVTDAMRLTPPRKMNAAMIAQITPITIGGMPNAVLNDALIELACTMLPVKPSAKMMASEKKPARNLPNLPVKRARM